MKNLFLLILLGLSTPLMAGANLGNLHCIGDSLTDGAGCSPGEGGYRHPLDRALTAASIGHTFVGTLNTWPNLSWIPGMHDGHGGWSTTDLTYGKNGEGCAPQWVASFQPQTVILMTGRNDSWDWFYSGSGWHDPYSTLVNLIYASDPNVTIYWCNPFMPRDWNYWEDQRCQAQDTALKQVISEQRTIGRKIFYVDTYHRLQGVPSDYSDAIHLNDSGYQKLERVIFLVILKTNPSSVNPFR